MSFPPVIASRQGRRGNPVLWIASSLVLLAMTFSACRQAPTDPDARALALGEQLRCPVCRGVPIAESPSELAKQMMGIVREEVAAGKTDAEILKSFEERYGEWALLQPKPQGMNLLVWILPALFLIGGAGIIIVRLKRQQ